MEEGEKGEDQEENAEGYRYTLYTQSAKREAEKMRWEDEVGMLVRRPGLVFRQVVLAAGTAGTVVRMGGDTMTASLSCRKRTCWRCGEP